MLRLVGLLWCFALWQQEQHGTTTNAFQMPTKHRLSIIRTSPFSPTSIYQSNNNNNKVDKGFNLLEVASQFVPQGRIVATAKESWRLLWQRFMVELAPQDKSGTYQRPTYTFAKTLGSTQYPVGNEEANKNRYHVYVGNPCPWCHRVRLVATILGLQNNQALGLTQLVDDPIKASRGGWIFGYSPPQAPNVKDLRELYQELSPNYQGRCTAPLLVDWKTRTIISNESKDIVRMLPLLTNLAWNGDSAENESSSASIELVPIALQSQIDETNGWIYSLINNGVYQCGFATTQEAYDRASAQVRQGMDRVEERLRSKPYLCGDVFTESDVMLLPTMLRFDTVYSPLFGAGGSRHWRLATDYPAIHKWMKRCWQEIDGVATSIDLDDAAKSYYKQLFPLNPGGIVPSVEITPQRLGLED